MTILLRISVHMMKSESQPGSHQANQLFVVLFSVSFLALLTDTLWPWEFSNEQKYYFCADGTWSAPGVEEQADDEAAASNVYQLFVDLKGAVDQQSLLLANEQEKTLTDNSGNVLQVAKYIHGMGNPHNGLVKSLGGAFGASLIIPNHSWLYVY
ncbi:hypothetical protein ACSPAB_01280 [Buttiauxella agrestis]